jgi:4'-phosphopantetheinyl transferase
LHPNERQYFDTLIIERRQFSYLLGRYVAKECIAVYAEKDDLTKVEIKHGVFKQPIVNYPLKPNIQVCIAQMTWR